MSAGPVASETNPGTPLAEHFTRTYFDLRIGIAVLGAALPVMLWLGGSILDGDPLRSSMSAYYYSPSMRNVFVGVLVAIGLCLVLYRGFSTPENRALDVGGLLAVGVAMVPTSAPGEGPTSRATLHAIMAILFFACIGYVCIWRASDTLSLIRDTRTARKLRATYRALGVAMVLSPLVAVAIATLVGSSSLVFLVEAAGVWTFAAYWSVKSYEMHVSDAEQLAMEGKLATTPRREVPGRMIQVVR